MNRRIIPVFVFSALSAAGFLHGQQAPLGGPVEGFAFDAPTRSIRSVIGLIGSASLGPAVVEDVDFASFAPGRDYAVAFRSRRGLFISALGSDQPSAVYLASPAIVPERVVWSGDGSTAVFYSQAQNRLQVVSGFPASANPGQVLDLSSMGGSLSAVAIGSDGQHIVAGLTGDRAGVYEIGDGQSLIPLLSIAKPSALAFSQDGASVYALDSTSGEISQFDLANSSTQTWPVSLEDPVAIAAARDASNRRVIYVAGRADRALVAYDGYSHEAVASVSLDFQPARIEPLGRNSFLLTTRNSDSDLLWSFTNRVKPAVYFVPATPLMGKVKHRPEVLSR